MMEPCPFCGTKAALVCMRGLEFWIECDECGAAAGKWPTEGMAREAWNKRTDGKPEAEILESWLR